MGLLSQKKIIKIVKNSIKKIIFLDFWSLVFDITLKIKVCDFKQNII